MPDTPITTPGAAAAVDRLALGATDARADSPSYGGLGGGLLGGGGLGCQCACFAEE